ncbi:hypothetical protein CPC08DRAFT_642107, partial [Agrocybe pediades]
IRASSLRRQEFTETVLSLTGKDLQLIRDVDTRWSSTFLMILRALDLRESLTEYIDKEAELTKFQLTLSEWEALSTIHRILLIPHAFQQLLSFEKQPTLAHTIPAFQTMINLWKDLQTEIPEVENIIQAGLDKLEGYQDKLDIVPANIIATCE